MKKFRDYAEDIYKCTKCGLCQAVCPVFQATGLETTVSRGKFTLLNGILNGHLKFNKQIAKHLEMCLGCRACFDFCPSGINAEEIIYAARAEYASQCGVNLVKKVIINGQKSKLIRFLNHAPKNSKKNAKIIYYPGCFETSAKAAKLVLEKNGFDVIIPRGFTCCGMSAKSAGDIRAFEEFMHNNIALIPDNADFIITECASCGSAWQGYPEHIAKKAVNIYKFLNDIDLYMPENASYNKTVTWHDPCHLARFQRIKAEPRNILNKIPGLKLIEMEEADKCCGAAGTFCVMRPKTSLSISGKKAQNILKTGADVVSTSCSGCKIGITQGLLSLKTINPIISPIEILAEIYSQE